MKVYLKNLLKHKTFKNISYLAIGNIIAQIFSIIGALYIPKLLGPTQYGIYNTVVAYVGLFVVFTFEGLNKVVIREISRNIDKAREILEETIGLRNFFSVIALVVSIIIAIFLNYETFTKVYIAIYSITLLLTGAQSTLNSIYQSFEEMKFLAYIAVIRQIIRVPISIYLLKIGYGVFSLIILQTLLVISIFIITYFHSRKIIIFNLFAHIKLKKKYIIPGIRFSLLEFLGTISTKIDLVMLSFLTIPEKVGLYALAYNLVNKGFLIRGPIVKSLYPFYTKKFIKGNIKNNALVKHSLLILIPMVVVYILVLLFSKFFILTIVGPKYGQSVEIFNVLFIYLILSFIIIPWGVSLQATNNEDISLWAGIIRASLKIILNLFFFYTYGIIGIAYATVLTFFVNNIFILKIGIKRLKDTNQI